MKTNRKPAAVSPRVAFIQKTYSLVEVSPGHFEARNNRQPAATGVFAGDRAYVCREARAWWGHFNHQDEAEAFSAIFPPVYA